MSEPSAQDPSTSIAAPAAVAAAPRTRRSPASAKSEQRIRDILRVGREVFAEKGYERATTTEIAQRLGISEATVFTYFRGKRELCVRVLGDWYDEIIAATEQGMPLGRPMREQLHYLVRTHLRLFLIQGTGLCALVLSEGRSKGQELGDSFLPLQRRYTAPLMDLLARGQASGEIRQDMPLRLLRSAVLGPMEHILWEVVAAPAASRTVDIDRVAEQLVTLLWSAVQAPSSELAALRQLRDDVAFALQRSNSS
ncbi:TetR/AcrR family transcriptional regulator [Sphaerotilus microaerophilus]|uniref:TetR family transcriptional regulator n=1 Tax=Sphaerotilus microaerophilus TaxID=2914710 RepID=A0ABM7YN23_9BURK|nr:TetR/AcrR family transcriptional regulator [Sphaerotilus sp. FB-5]BDI05858.1 TetR family transcriptional regulator [Sphaerotilus sp. FB-5]